jgi:hypothetical protein
MCRLFECSLSNEVFVEINDEEHSDLNSSFNALEGKKLKKERIYGINPYFKEIISKNFRESPNMQPMDVMK